MQGSILLPLIGGALIGASSTFLLAGIGRIAGISGILGQLLGRPSKDHHWRASFILGLILGGFILFHTHPHLFVTHLELNKFQIILAGVLVGFGTRLGSGCTSGHGVCGLSRLKIRSFVATIIFMMTAMVTVFIKGFIQ